MKRWYDRVTEGAMFIGIRNCRKVVIKIENQKGEISGC